MNPEETRRQESVHELTQALLEAGTAWARYGLSMARASLDVSARSLDATAGFLGALADRLVLPETRETLDGSDHDRK